MKANRERVVALTVSFENRETGAVSSKVPFPVDIGLAAPLVRAQQN